MKTRTNIRHNSEAREICPRGVEANYVIWSEIFGAVKVGRTCNLECDFRAATRYYPDAVVVAIKVTGDRTISTRTEGLMQGLFDSLNLRKNSGKRSEVYKADSPEKFIKAL